MPNTKTAPAKELPLGRPRATKYLEIVASRDGKRKAAAVEKKARELAAADGATVVRFEYVAEAAGIDLDQMAVELREHGISTSPSNVKRGTLRPAKRTKKMAAKTAAKDGPGNARPATAKTQPSPTRTSKASSRSGKDVKPDPKSRQATATGSRKRNGSSPTPAGSRGRAAGSSHSKSAQLRKLREKQASKR